MPFSFFATLFAFLLFTSPILAAEAPTAQDKLAPHQVLRGSFIETHPVKGFDKPMSTSGTFVVAPQYGLLWEIQKPMATTTIITRETSIQDIGGLVIKLPIKNLQRLYDIVSSALIGRWGTLEKDFVITKGAKDAPWQLTLTPRRDVQSPMPYKVITVSGNRFIESIVLTKLNGAYESVTFSEQTLTSLPLSGEEATKFAKIKKTSQEETQ